MRRRFWVPLGLGLVALLLLVAGFTRGSAQHRSSTAKPLQGKVVWYMDVLNANPILNAWAQAINKPIQAAGGKLVRSYALNQAGQLDIAVQAQAFDRATAAKPAAIVYFVLDPKSQKPQVKRALAAGIPVFAMFGKPEGFKVNAYITGQNYKQGQVVGNALANVLPKGAKVTVIAGLPTPNVEGELDGVQAVFKKRGLVFVGSRDKQRNLTDIASGGQEIMQGLLQKYPDLQGIVGFNDDTALGIIAATKAARKQGQIKVASRNGSTPAIDAIKKGDLVATCDIDPITVGETLGKAIVAQVSGKANYSGKELSGPDPGNGKLWPKGCLVTKANAGRYVPWEKRIKYVKIQER